MYYFADRNKVHGIELIAVVAQVDEELSCAAVPLGFAVICRLPRAAGSQRGGEGDGAHRIVHTWLARIVSNSPFRPTALKVIRARNAELRDETWHNAEESTAVEELLPHQPHDVRNALRCPIS